MYTKNLLMLLNWAVNWWFVQWNVFNETIVLTFCLFYWHPALLRRKTILMWKGKRNQTLSSFQMKMIMVTLTSVNSWVSMPSPVYQWRKAWRLNIMSNCSMVLLRRLKLWNLSFSNVSVHSVSRLSRYLTYATLHTLPYNVMYRESFEALWVAEERRPIFKDSIWIEWKHW